MLNKNLFLNRKGFTFIEVIVVIVIVAILITAWAFYNKGQLNSAYMNEAKMFADKIVVQEKLYFAEKNKFTTTVEVDKFADLLLDTKQNKYYKKFIITETSGKLYITLKTTDTKLSGYNIKATYDPATDKVIHEKISS